MPDQPQNMPENVPAGADSATGLPVLRPGGMIASGGRMMKPNMGGASTVALVPTLPSPISLQHITIGKLREPLPGMEHTPPPSPAPTLTPKTAPDSSTALPVLRPGGMIASRGMKPNMGGASTVALVQPEQTSPALMPQVTIGKVKEPLPGSEQTPPLSQPSVSSPGLPLLRPGGLIAKTGRLMKTHIDGASTVPLDPLSKMATPQPSPEKPASAVLANGSIPVVRNGPSQLFGLNGAETQLVAKAEVELRRRLSQKVAVTGPNAAKTIRRTAEMALLMSGRSFEAANTGNSAAPLEELRNEQIPAKVLECLERGDLISARRYLRRGVAAAQPEDYWSLWSELGTAHYEKGQFAEARIAYNQACEIFPDRLISHFNLGTAKLMTGDFNGALECFQKADDIESFQPKVLCNVGATYFLQDEYDSAEEILLSTIEIQPNYVRALNTLASVFGATNRLDEALEMCDQVLRYSPSHSEAAFKKGVIHLSQNQIDEAVEYLKLATKSPDIQFDAQCFLAQALAAANRPGDAERLMNAVMAWSSKLDQELVAASWKAVAHGWKEANEMERAAAAFQKACASAPLDPEMWLELGLMHSDGAQQLDALECFQTYLRLHEEVPREKTLEQCSLFQGGKEAAKVGLVVDDKKKEEPDAA